MPHEKFHYKSLEEVQARAAELGVRLPFAADTRALTQPLTVGNVTFANRMGIAPMEGADSLPNGSPSDYTLRRYVKEAIGGSAIIWFEAISIVEEGRSSPWVIQPMGATSSAQQVMAIRPKRKKPLGICLSWKA